MRVARRLSMLGAVGVVAACSRAPDVDAGPRLHPPRERSDEPVGDGAEANDPAQHSVLNAISKSYATYFRADGIWWAPYDCAAPPDDTPRISGAPPGTPHGRKLYTLQIADFASYARDTAMEAQPKGGRREPLVQTPAGVEQVVVKVSYEPVADRPEKPKVFGIGSVTRDGKTFWPGEQRDLFVMYKPTDPKIETDAGWLYGTVSADGQTITSAGKVKSCMRCHAKAPHGRLFGVRR